MRSAIVVLAAAATLAAVVPASLHAQAMPAPRRYTLAAGPAVVLDHAPPSMGAHLRGSVAARAGLRPLNVVADVYATRLFPGTETVFAPGPIGVRRAETQVGVGVSGQATLFPSRAVSPYLLAGAVLRHSSATVSAEGESLKDTALQPDLLLGGGLSVRAGGRRLSLETRFYGGTTIYMPVTIGLTF
jgi:hypothetical protein